MIEISDKNPEFKIQNLEFKILKSAFRLILILNLRIQLYMKRDHFPTKLEKYCSIIRLTVIFAPKFTGMIIRLDAPELLNGLVNKAENLLVYFYNDGCAPCVSLRPKVEQLIGERFPKMDMVYVDASRFPGLIADFQAFSFPVLIFFFEGKEYLRFSKYVSISELSESIGRIYDLYHLPN